ncbi:MAG: hypothetical protein ACRDGS_16825, partial [Chloroflexota bacterium]
ITDTIKSAVVGVVGSDRMIANSLAKGGPDYGDAKVQEQYKEAQIKAKKLEAARQAEEKQNGSSSINPEDAFKDLPEAYRPKTATTPEEKAVSTNKATFLEEDVVERAAKQRKANDNHAMRELKANLGRQLQEAPKGSVARAGIKAKLKVLEEKDDLAKLNPQAVERKLKKAELKATLKLIESKEGKWKGHKVRASTLTGEQKKSATLAKGMLEGELANLKGTQKAADGPKNSDAWVKKLHDPNADKAGTALDATSTVAGSGATSALGAKEIAHLAGNDTVAGATHTADGKTVVDQVGTAQQGGDTLGAVAELTALGSQLASAASIAKAYQEGDPAEKKLAVDQTIDLGFSLSKTLASLGTEATRMAGDFGGADMATQMAADVLPGFDLAAGGLSLIDDSIKLYEASSRLSSQGKHRKQAKAAGATHVAKSISQFKNQNQALATSGAVDVTADVLKITGAAISLSGIGVVVGHPIKFVGMAVQLLNSAAMATYGSVKAGNQAQARAADMLALPGGAEMLLRHDRKHGIQTLIHEARHGQGEGQKVALKELESLGIDQKVLDGSSDKALRALALGRMKLKEDSKTLGQSLKEGKEDAKEFFHEDTGEQIKVLAKVKNKLKYGGAGDRGVGWKIKMRLGADVVESTASIHKLLLSLSDAERKELGITQEDIDATRTQYEREQKASHIRHISAPR